MLKTLCRYLQVKAIYWQETTEQGTFSFALILWNLTPVYFALVFLYGLYSGKHSLWISAWIDHYCIKAGLFFLGKLLPYFSD